MAQAPGQAPRRRGHRRRDDRRAADVIRGMRAMLRKDALEKELLDVRVVVDEVVAMLEELAKK